MEMVFAEVVEEEEAAESRQEQKGRSLCNGEDMVSGMSVGRACGCSGIPGHQYGLHCLVHVLPFRKSLSC